MHIAGIKCFLTVFLLISIACDSLEEDSKSIQEKKQASQDEDLKDADDKKPPTDDKDLPTPPKDDKDTPPPLPPPADEDDPPPPPPPLEDDPPPSGQACNEIVGVLICEDFESNGINETKWTKLEKNGATASVSTARARDGQKSLNIVTQNTIGNSFFLSPKNIFPVANNHFFGRAYLYIDGQLPLGHNVVMSTSSMVDGTSAVHRLDASKHKFNSRYGHKSITVHGGIRIPESGAQDFDFPANKWVCIEWELDGNQNSMRYWFDGVFASTLEVKGDENPVWRAGQFKTFEIGWKALQTYSLSYSFYWDSIVLASQRIGCLSP